MFKIFVRLGCFFCWREVFVLMILNIEMVLKLVFDISVVWVVDEYYFFIFLYWVSILSIFKYMYVIFYWMYIYIMQNNIVDIGVIKLLINISVIIKNIF